MAGPIQGAISGAIGGVASAVTTAKFVGEQKKAREEQEKQTAIATEQKVISEKAAAETAAIKEAGEKAKAAEYVETAVQNIYNDPARMDEAKKAFKKKSGKSNRWANELWGRESESSKREAARVQANLRISSELNNPESSLGISYKYAKGEINATEYALSLRQNLLEERLKSIDPRATWLIENKKKGNK